MVASYLGEVQVHEQAQEEKAPTRKLSGVSVLFWPWIEMTYFSKLPPI
jgi:hypothetical protein